MVFFSTTRRFLMGGWLLAGLLAAGCGSQTDSIDTPDVRPISRAPAGIYLGTLRRSDTPVEMAVTAMIDDDRLYLFDSLGVLIGGGRYDAVDSGGMSWQSRVFREVPAPPPEPDPDPDAEPDPDAPPPPTTVIRAEIWTASGAFKADAEVVLSYSASLVSSPGLLDSGTVTLIYNKALYERPSDVSLLSGVNWGAEDQAGYPLVSLSIGGGGDLIGAHAVQACTYSGSVTLIRQQFNLYRVALTTTCNTAVQPQPPPRVESGLAMLRREPDGKDTLVMVATGLSGGTLFQLKKLN